MIVSFVSTVFMKRKAVAHFRLLTIQQSLLVFQITKVTVWGFFPGSFFPDTAKYMEVTYLRKDDLD